MKKIIKFLSIFLLLLTSCETSTEDPLYLKNADKVGLTPVIIGGGSGTYSVSGRSFYRKFGKFNNVSFKKVKDKKYEPYFYFNCALLSFKYKNRINSFFLVDDGNVLLSVSLSDDGFF